jgi:hypothetical protein
METIIVCSKAAHDSAPLPGAGRRDSYLDSDVIAKPAAGSKEDTMMYKCLTPIRLTVAFLTLAIGPDVVQRSPGMNAIAK